MTASLVLAWRFDNGAALWRGMYGDMEREWLLERQRRIDLEELVGWTQKVTA